MNEFKYVYPGMIGERETRHEAIGDLASCEGTLMSLTEQAEPRLSWPRKRRTDGKEWWS